MISGKGSGDDACRASLLVDGPDAADPRGVPGRSQRTRHLTELLIATGQFDAAWLSRDVFNGGRAVAAGELDSPIPAHNALMRWLPSSYPGHDGYIPAHDAAGRELLFTLMLDGDRKADHLFFWRDRDAGAEWTPAVAGLCRGWYNLPHDGWGRLVSDGLADAIADGPYRQPRSFVQALRDDPLGTMAAACDLQEPAVDLEELRASWDPDLERRLRERLNALAAISAEHESLCRVRLRDAAMLADELDLNREQRALLVEACAHDLPFSAGPAPSASVADALAQAGWGASADGAHLPVAQPHSPMGAALADVRLAGLAARSADRHAALLAAEAGVGAADGAAQLEVLRARCARTPLHTTAGRRLWQKQLRAQEARLRAIRSFVVGRRLRRPAGEKQLRPAGV